MLAAALQTSILLLFAVIDMALLSLPAFVICLSLIGIGMWLYSRRLKEVNVWIQRTSQQEIHSFNTIRDLLDGFKEVKLNDDRSRDLMRDIVESAEMLRSMKMSRLTCSPSIILWPIVCFTSPSPQYSFSCPGSSLFRGDRSGHDDVLFIIGPLGGSACVDVMELAQHRQLDPARVENLLMRQKAVALPYEDAITYGVDAAQSRCWIPWTTRPEMGANSSGGSCLD